MCFEGWLGAPIERPTSAAVSPVQPFRSGLRCCVWGKLVPTAEDQINTAASLDLSINHDVNNTLTVGLDTPCIHNLDTTPGLLRCLL